MAAIRGGDIGRTTPLDPDDREKDHPLHRGCGTQSGISCLTAQPTNSPHFPRFTHFHLVRLLENTIHVPELMAVEVERAQSKHIEQYPAQRNPSGVDQASN